MLYLVGKSLHVIGFISWFAGLFYLPRIFIYHAEAGDRAGPERDVLRAQLELMAVRLWRIITVPAAVVTFVGGLTMVVQLPEIPSWLWWKFGWLALLVGYHLACGNIRAQQAAGTSRWTSRQLRLFNEGATMIMVAIVCLAVFKSSLSALWGVFGLLALGLFLMLGIKLYQRLRSEPVTSGGRVPSEVETSAGP